jgi:glycerol-3-phosphate acyltransferase PlsY
VVSVADAHGAAFATLVLGAYFLGTFPTAVLVARSKGHDVLHEGSGNPGATNVYRVAGRRAGAAVFAGDFLKGVLAAAAGALIEGRHTNLALALGTAAVVGHCLPVQRRFRGGKGVATAAGFALVVEPLIGLAAAAVWFTLLKLTHRASIASVTVAVAAPVAILLWRGPHTEAAVMGAVALFVVSRHWRNISRLLRGEESSLPGVGRSG